RRGRVRHRDHVRGAVRAGRGNPRRRVERPPRRALRCPRRLDLVDARAAGRPAAGLSPSGRGAVMTDPVLLDVSERIATVTLNRPEARNALSSEVLALLPARIGDAEGRDDVDVIILTGADPAFCAGLDLKELGSGAGTLGRVAGDGVRRP